MNSNDSRPQGTVLLRPLLARLLDAGAAVGAPPDRVDEMRRRLLHCAREVETTAHRAAYNVHHDALPASHRRGNRVVVEIDIAAADQGNVLKGFAILPLCHRTIQVDMPEPAAAASLSPVETPSYDVALEASLRDWIAGVVRRDEVAFTQLYNATVSRAWSVAMRIVRQQEAAEEVVEDCFWQVWREAERFDAARGRVLTWILTICRSRALDYLRRKDIAEPVAEIETLRSSELADDEDPLDILGATERASAVHQALAQLKPKERQMISLAFFRGLTHQEIADACRMPLGSVKTTMHKAFRQLESILGDQGWDQSDE